MKTYLIKIVASYDYVTCKLVHARSISEALNSVEVRSGEHIASCEELT